MRVISRKALRKAAEKHAGLSEPLDAWYKIASAAQWKTLADVRKTWASTDVVGDCTVFNVKGNRYRLIVKIRYQRQMIFLKSVLTHAEYDKERWKEECNCFPKRKTH